MKSGKREIKGVIFDLDGTLLDSREERVTAWSKAFRLHGVEVPDSELRPLIGLPGITLGSRYCSDPASVETDEERFFTELLPSIEYFPDVRETLKGLENEGIRVSIVTSSRRSLLEKMDLPAKIVVCIDDVKAGKPGTEPYSLACRLMGLEPENVLVVGDAENDMIPCISIGSVCVFFRDGRSIESGNSHYYADRIGEIPEIIRKINKGK